MPYYYWRGVMADAQLCKGSTFAHDEASLDDMLFKQHIALISCKAVRQFHIMPVSLLNKLFFFEQLQALLAAGLHVWQALLIISKQTTDARFAAAMYQMSKAIEQGQPLHTALEQYPWIFNHEMVCVVETGAQAGNLPIALKALCVYLEETYQFKKRLRGLLLLPLFTLVVFVMITLILLVVIIPRYASLFASMGKQLPYATGLLLQLSKSMMSYSVWSFVAAMSILSFVVWYIKRIPSITMKWDRLVASLPYLGSCVKKVSLVYFLQSVALLLQGGMPLVPALEIARRSIANKYLREQLRMLISKVQAGQSLSEAMQQVDNSFFTQDVLLLVTVGEQTASLGLMMQRAAYIYQQQVKHMLNRYTVILQPMLILLLGLMVAGLIYAVYMPLFNLADMV